MSVRMTADPECASSLRCARVSVRPAISAKRAAAPPSQQCAALPTSSALSGQRTRQQYRLGSSLTSQKTPLSAVHRVYAPRATSALLASGSHVLRGRTLTSRELPAQRYAVVCENAMRLRRQNPDPYFFVFIRIFILVFGSVRCWVLLPRR